MTQRLSTFDFRLSTRASRGFTLVELLISISVLMVLTGTVLASYKGYNNNAYFANASEDIVLALRQAQVYGVGTKGNGVGSFNVPYGIHINMLTSPQQIVFFADTSPVGSLDGKYTAGVGGDRLIETIQWKAPIGITSLECGANVPCTRNIMSVTFKRPNPDAIIMQGDDTGGTVSLGRITISNGAAGSNLKYSKVIITKAGQIYLE